MWDVIGKIGSAVLPSVLSGLFGNYQQNKANQSNVQMVRETNQANIAQTESANKSNELIAQLANKLQWDMQKDAQSWNAHQIASERAYNSPVSQVQRLLAAGLNPNNASADTQAGFAGSPMGSATTGAPAQAAQLIAPQVQPVTAMSSSLGQIASIISALHQTSITSEASRYGADVAAGASRFGSELSAKVSREGQAIQKELQEKHLTIENNKANAEMALSSALTDQANAQVSKIKSETVAQDIVNSNLPAKLAAETHATAMQAKTSLMNATGFLKQIAQDYELRKEQNTLDKREFLQSVVQQARYFMIDQNKANVSNRVSERALQLSIDQWNKQFEGMGELWNFIGISGNAAANGALLRMLLK